MCCQPEGKSGLSPAKPYNIAKRTVWEAHQQVKANRGSAGIDGETLFEFDRNLLKNLQKLWNRMSSGSYFPRPVKQVEIPTASGGKRNLGVPAVSADIRTSHTPESVDAARLLAFNRDHCSVEAHHYILDWNWDEDRYTLRTGHGPENIPRLRRFATDLIKSKSRDSVAVTIAKLARNVRRVFDSLRMTGNSVPLLPIPCDEAS